VVDQGKIPNMGVEPTNSNHIEGNKSGIAPEQSEALQKLARAIVRETGLVRDPVQEAAEKAHQQFIEGGREHWKAQVDFFKHMATTSGAALVAVAALTGVLRPPPGTSSPITGMVLFALYVAGALFLTANIGAPRSVCKSRSSWYPYRCRLRASVGAREAVHRGAAGAPTVVEEDVRG
jgi:hypothetical protein